MSLVTSNLPITVFIYMVSWIYSDPYNIVLETGVTIIDQKRARSGKSARIVLEPSGRLCMMIL